NMVENSAKLGKYMLEQMKGLNSPLIREVRGKGLWIGVDFEPKRVSARTVCEKMMARGILSKETHETVVRFAPPLTITKEQIDWALDQFRKVLSELE
ncbi:MAG: aminotransferase class III-fold pyridoxal phosphate-dependent enzyme, partial [Alphaproteobacteria bacterium]|nr:aminotransferase class III-fold pyridoxal phosphate-dependent enzyme [Alphaproteobacteria bacterium]